MGEPKTMTAEDAAKHLQVHIKTGNERCIAADALRTVIDLDRQIRRLRFELAAERGADGPWTAIGWRFDFACWGWRDDAGRDACIHEPDESGTSVWSAGDGGKMRRVGGAQTSLAAIEQACDALGIPTPWERAT